MPVVLVVVMSVVNLAILAYFDKQNSGFGSEAAAASGLADETGINQEASAINRLSPNFNSGSELVGQATNFIIVDSAYLLNSNNPLSGVLPTRDGLLTYKIQKGDTLARIAANFGISLNTLLWANKNISEKNVKVGQEIVILPITGVLHTVQPGDTLESIAAQYSVDVSKIIAVNTGISPVRMEDRSMIIVPGGKPVKFAVTGYSVNLPSLTGYFAIPTTGWNWGQLHNYNAVDIANSCGTPVYASAEGLVAEVSDNLDWNGGYGNYILIEHLNGTKTRYAHLEKIFTTVGDYILKGDLIGNIGNTGSTHGPTGCHLHFEIYGARNPFAK